jgi:hypothetical protein
MVTDRDEAREVSKISATSEISQALGPRPRKRYRKVGTYIYRGEC